MMRKFGDVVTSFSRNLHARKLPEMPNQNDPIPLNNPRTVSLPALEIITSKYLAICVRILNISIGTAAIILAGYALAFHTTQPYWPFLIAVSTSKWLGTPGQKDWHWRQIVSSILLNIIDATILGFEIWGPPLQPPTTRTSSQQYVLPRGYRASPGWRGLFDLVIWVVLIITTGGITRCDDFRVPCKDDGKAPAAQYLGIIITSASFLVPHNAYILKQEAESLIFGCV